MTIPNFVLQESDTERSPWEERYLDHPFENELLPIRVEEKRQDIQSKLVNFINIRHVQLVIQRVGFEHILKLAACSINPGN